MPLLEATTEVRTGESLHLTQRDDLQWLAERPLQERIRFEATASTAYVLGLPRRPGELSSATDLPTGYNPRTIAWAQALRADPALRRADATTLAQAVLKHIRTGGYSYTLSPGDYGRDAVDEFWLDRKEGFCEHFAASFVVIMRALGIPARVITGYQGTDIDPVDGFNIVRQSSAHAWPSTGRPTPAGSVPTPPAPSRPTASAAAADWWCSRASWPAPSAT